MDTTQLFSLKGRSALITGGSRGIGRMIAEGFLAQGARVYISARKAAACDQTAKELSAFGHCVSLPADVSTLEGAQARIHANGEQQKRTPGVLSFYDGTWRRSAVGGGSAHVARSTTVSRRHPRDRGYRAR